MHSALLKFQIYQRAQLLKTVTLTQSSIQIGSLASASLRIEDDNVSKMHATIEVTDPQHVMITDLGSVSGTKVNGQRVQTAQIHSGDEIQVGNTTIVVFIDAVSDRAPLPRSASYTAAPAENIENTFVPDVVEVSALFEDSVQQNHQIYRQKKEGIDFKAPTLLAYGVASLLAVFLVILVAHGKMNDLTTARDEWIKNGHATADFRVPSSMWYDYRSDLLAGLLLLQGIATIAVGLSLRGGRRKETRFTVGQSARASFFMQDIFEGQDFSLVEGQTENFVVHFTDSMMGELYQEGRVTTVQQLIRGGLATPSPLKAGVYDFVLPAKSRVILQFGDIRFYIASTPQGRQYPASLEIDWRILGAAAALLVLVATVVSLVPENQEDMDQEIKRKQKELKDNKDNIPSQAEQKPKLRPVLEKPESGGGPAGKKAAGEEGKMGLKTAEKRDTRMSLKGNEKDAVIGKTAAEQAEEDAKNAGVLGILKAQGNPLASIFGKDRALGNEAMAAMGGLVGIESGDAYGVGGLGLVGTGKGGGGFGEGTAGTGNFGTIGKGFGGSGHGGIGPGGYGRGVGGLGGRTGSGPTIQAGKPEVKGSLDKELIRRVIQRHINETKFCYEKELMRDSSLGGRVFVRFTIMRGGKVAGAVFDIASSTLKNVNVGSCIAAAVRRWEFPSPQGGVVEVNYPFILKTAGTE